MGAGGPPGFYDPLSPKQTGFASAYGVASPPYISGVGLLGAVSSVNGTRTPVTGASGVSLLHATTPGFPDNFYDSTGAIGFAPISAANPQGYFKFSLDVLTSTRFFVGFCGQGNGGATGVWPGTDDPQFPMAGLQFSSYRPDTNFQFMVRDQSGGTRTLVDSGVAVDTAVHYLLVEIVGSTSVVITLYDASEALQATHTFTANLPLAGASLHQQICQTCANGGSHTFYFMRQLLDT